MTELSLCTLQHFFGLPPEGQSVAPTGNAGAKARWHREATGLAPRCLGAGVLCALGG